MFTVIPGRGAVVGERFVTHPSVRKICFTGSTAVGKMIMKGCADQVKRCTLELGGKSANVIFADADLAQAAATAPYAVFDNAGQDCCARSRILVQASAYEEFLDRLHQAVEAMVVTNPADEAAEMGPLISAGQRASVQGYLDEVDVAFAGDAPTGPGFWLPPSVVAATSPEQRIWREEVFGPVVAVLPFEDEDDAVALGQRHRVRAVRVDLHQRSRARTAGVPGRSSGESERQLPLLGPLLDTVRWVQAVWSRPRAGPGCPARLHRGEERVLQRRKGTLMAGRVEGRVAVVTGGCSGIGLASVRRLAAEGARVVIGDVDLDRGPEVAEEVGGIFRPCDVTSKDEVDALFATAQQAYGSVDIAFNNAGISPPEDDSILDTDLDAWRRVQDVNLTSVYLCCKAALPYMLEQGRGSIINTASFVAVMGAATSQISYSASKGGVLTMSRELGVQFARQGVRVNALCPGPVNTPMLQELFAKDPERAARRLVHIPLGRFAEPEEMANAVLFLASDESSFVTASTFLVDGGISAAYVTPL